MFQGFCFRSAVAFASTLLVGAFIAAPVQAQISFNSNGLPGTSLNNPTSIDFGPDGRLYVSQQDGQIKVFTLQRNDSADYTILDTEIITLIRDDVPNHNDDGAENATNARQVTGLMVVGTANNPVLYVTSSDWRISVGTDTGLDTNSGVISRLICVGGITGNQCQAWDHVDLVRGLPRSEENHSTNGMDLDTSTNILYVMSGGNANKGAPGNNFSGTPEYFLSASMLAVDLNAIEQIENDNGGPFVDARNGARFIYDLVTIDDPTRANIDNTSPEFPYSVDHPYYNLSIDLGDPFGGNNSLNQAIPVPGGPVQIQSPGYRNAFDVVVAESGRIYTWDNGPNTNWGGLPLLFESDGTPKGTTGFNAGAGDYCTNDFNESGSAGHGDSLHDATVPGYYGGHPAPIRAFPGGDNVVNYQNSGGWAQVGPKYSLHALLPAGFGVNASDFPNNPVECDYLADSPAKVLETVSSSTNGLDEYRATNFAGEMQGDLLAASFNGNIYRCKPDGPSSLINLPGPEGGLSTGDCEVLFGGFGSQPLDVTTQGDGDPFPGTVWAAVYGADSVYVFEPDDFLVCNPADPAGDGDTDGFTNGDEADNGTDPCNGGSKPEDNDGDFLSDLNDPDDDNDGTPDVSDPFALDANNGLGTAIPLNYPFFNDNPGSGLFGLGFTGLMLDVGGANTWLDLFDPTLLAAGGATGRLSVESVTTGDAFTNNNTQENAFLLGVDADTNTPPFVIHSRVDSPFFTFGGSNVPAPANFQSFGVFLGTGDMDNYLKVVVSASGGAGGIQVGTEVNGAFSSQNFDNSNWTGSILDAPSVDFYLTVDPQNSEVQVSVSLDVGVTVIPLGTTFPIPAAWLSPSDDQGLAIGLISTAFNASPFVATWDFLNVNFAEVTAPGAWAQVNNEFAETRHEGAFVQAGDKFYVLGGRESTTVRIYDPATDNWSNGADSPILLHHFQAVELDGLIYVLGAMTGTCCAEPEAPNVYIYDPAADAWITGPAMPAGRERGGAGAALYNGKIYLISGNTNGHTGPVSAAVDVFDPATGIFTPLDDIPNPRDHFFATVANDKLYVVGGRTSGDPDTFAGTIPEVDVLDLVTEIWSTLPAGSNLPTPRAAAPTGLIGNEIIIAGGESGTQTDAHAETEALNLATNTWRALTNMLSPRHATQAIVSNDGFYVAAGSPTRGGPGAAQMDLEALYLFGPTAPTGNAINVSTLTAPVNVDFGAQANGSTTSQAALLSNTGGDQGIVIEDVVITSGTSFTLTAPWGAPVVIAPGANLNIALEFSPTASGPAVGNVQITHSGGQTLDITLQGDGQQLLTPLFRVNAGGPQIAATDGGPNWTIDTAGTNSQYAVLGGCGLNCNRTGGYGPLTSRDASVPAYAPNALFDSERWDPAAVPEMQWVFPVTDGNTYRVRFYLMNGFDGTAAPGARIFNIAVEGVTPPALTGIDPSALWGDNGAGMLEHTVTAIGGTLDIEFIHDVENPLINAIEVLSVTDVVANVPPQILPIATQFSLEGEDIDFTILATDSDGPNNITFGATGLPPGLSVVDPTNGHVAGEIAAGAAANSPYLVTVSAFDGADTSELQFNWFVNDPSGAEIVLHRINVGGAQVAAADATLPDWSADNAASPSAFRIGAGGLNIYNGNSGGAFAGPIIMTDPSIPSSAPAVMFNFERYDVLAAPEMTWALPVTIGDLVEVRLYFAELFGGANAIGDRIFSVSVEGAVPAEFTDLDPFATAGPKGAFMRSTTLTVTDDLLDLVFIHNVENPALKGIEVIKFDASSNTPPEVTNPGDQAGFEGDVVNLPIIATDADLNTLSYSAINLPPDLSIDPATGEITGTLSLGGDGAFVESGGLVVIEMESADSIPANWAVETTFADATGEYLRYNGPNNLGNPGIDVITYPVEIQTPGVYRFQWRNAFGAGTNPTEHNDNWVKIEANAFYGEQGGGSIVCPKGFNPAENDCAGTEPEGAGAGGWFKAYRSGGTVGTWNWLTNTSDNDAHPIFARFDAPGTYNILVSGRSTDHAIDRMVLYKADTINEADATLPTVPESPRNGVAAAEGSPYATEVTVSDGTDPVTVTFEWVVAPFVDEPRATVSLTPTGSLTASTFGAGSIAVENLSTGNQEIVSVSIDLSTGVLVDMVFDPQGTAGDALGKGLEPNGGAGATGYVVPANNEVDPFSQPHNGVDETAGFDVINMAFTDFDPGEVFTFSVDIDPTSILDATGTGDAGSVGGLELTGATVEIVFSDGTILTAETFYIGGSAGGSIATARPNTLTAPTISVTGATLEPTTLSPDHTAAVIPAGEAAQTVVITGTPGATVRLLQLEGELLAGFGNELELFEANEVIAFTEYTAVIGLDGTVEIAVVLTRSDPLIGGFNHFTAVIDDGGVTGPNSNYIVLELDSGLPNVPPAAANDLGAVDVGASVQINLLDNDQDIDGILDVASLVFVDQPLFGTLTPVGLGAFTYQHDGLSEVNDLFSYTVNDNDGATSNLATVRIQVGLLTDLPDDVDGDGDPNATDPDDDNDGFLDTEDPFAIDASNGGDNNLPISLPMFSNDPGTGLFGLGFQGLMTNGVIGGVQGDDYQDLYSLDRVFVDDNSGVLTLFDVDAGDAFQGNNSQTHAFQLGLNVDTESQPFVVHGRILAPWFDGVATPANFLSHGIFIGTGDQDNYLKMVFDGNAGNIELQLEDGGATISGQNLGPALLGSVGVDLFLLIDPALGTAQAQLSVDGQPLQNLGAPIVLPSAWLDSGDAFGLAMGIIATSFGSGDVFDANFDLLEAYFLATDDVFTVNEDAAPVSLDVLANDHVDPDLFIQGITQPLVGGSVALDDNGTPGDPSDDVIVFTPTPDFTGDVLFTYTVEDGAGLTAVASVSITVAEVNDAPVVTLGADQLSLEDAGAQTVPAFAGFAAGAGELQANLGYTVVNDNNGLFLTQPAIDTAGELTYEAAADANGVAIVTVTAQDDGGTANGGVDTSAEQQFTITVNPVNDAPSITIGTDQNITEDTGAQLVAAFATGFAPGGGADEASQLIAGFPVSNDNNTLFDVQPAIALNGDLSYTPAAGANGVATVSVQVQDNGGTADGGVDTSTVQTFDITIDNVNDAPSITLAGDQDVLEDSGAQSVPGFASAFDAGPGEGDQSLVDFVVSNNNNSLFAVQPDVANDGTLSYTPADNANGVALVSVQVQDDGGTANGGVDISVLQNILITVTAVNDAPSVALIGNQSVVEDAGAQQVAGFANSFAPGGGADEAAQAVLGYAAGNDNPGLFLVEPSIDASGTLSYTPANDANGVALVEVTVQDNGGTANGGVDTSAITSFTISVTAVNDAPSVTLAGDQGSLEDAGAQLVANFATGFDAGPGESDQSLAAYLVTNDNNALFDVQPGIATDGSLTYTAAADANGIAQVSVQVTDDGGTDNGGVDTSDIQVFNISVTAVNDAPSITLGGDQQVSEDAGPQTVVAFAGALVPGGGVDEDSQTVSDFLVSNDNNGLFSAQPDISNSGDLTYTTADNASGVAIVTVQVQDDGGTSDGGADTSAQQTFTITVGTVNDAPSVVLAGDQSVNEDSGAQLVAGFASGFNAGQDEDDQEVADYIVSNDNNALFSVQPDVANDGSLSFTPAADANGSAVVSVQVQDDGGTDGGGEDTSAVQTFTVTVNAVNDAPGIVIGPDQTVALNSGVQLVAGFATGFTPGGGPDEAGQAIDEFVVSNDNPGLFQVQPDIGLDGRLTYAVNDEEFGSATVSVQVRDDGGVANGGVDISAIQTFTLTVNPEQMPPTIQKVDTVAGTGDAILSVNERTRASLTQLLVTFSEDVSANGGSDAGSYRLYSAGPNGVVDSLSCAGAVGDDVELVIDGVTWLGASNTAALAINGGVDLVEDEYLFLACDTITDAVDNALDGDANDTAGGEYNLPFAIVRTNNFVNPNFDTGVASWITDGFSFNTEDADSHLTSGSVQWDQQANGNAEGNLFQCVVLDQSGAYTIAGRSRITTTDADATVEVMVDAFADTDCAGTLLGSEMSAVLSGDTAGAWAPFQVSGSTPPRARSVLVGVISSGQVPNATTVELDNLFIESVSVLFKDGFED